MTRLALRDFDAVVAVARRGSFRPSAIDLGLSPTALRHIIARIEGELGARVLEDHGARGTYYACAGLAETEGPSGRNFARSDLARLTANGHEIGCHTFGHDDCAQRPVFDTLQDLAKNRDALANMAAPLLETLAYPYGETTSELKRSLPPRFEIGRAS